MKTYEKLYAVREKKTKKLISKRHSNPFFTYKRNAESQIKEMESPYWGYKEGELEIVTFRLEEIEYE